MSNVLGPENWWRTNNRAINMGLMEADKLNALNCDAISPLLSSRSNFSPSAVENYSSILLERAKLTSFVFFCSQRFNIPLQVKKTSCSSSSSKYFVAFMEDRVCRDSHFLVVNGIPLPRAFLM